MGRLTEIYIQTQALDFLRTYYQKKYKVEKLFARMEVRTKITSKGFGRADGLLCFHSTKQKNHLVSLEAKSHKTMGSLLTYWNEITFGIQLLLSVIVGALIGVYFMSNFNWYWILLVSLITGYLGGFFTLLILLFFEPTSLKKLGVIEQLKRYPANEQWIAISKDSLNLSTNKKVEFFNQANNENIFSICKSKGIGLLLVTNQKVELKVVAKFKKGKYLSKYAIEEKIKAELNV